mgnify:CR=1 FL=1
MKTKVVLTVATLLGIMGIAYAAQSSKKASCSGVVVCPLNGNAICADECPLNK